MSTVIDLFERHGYVLELLACVAATTWKLERQERFAVRLTGILLAEVCFTIVWEQVPHNLYTESLRTFLLWSIAAVGIRLCFRIAAAWAVFYATAAGTMQHIIYRGAKLLQNAVYHMDRQYWAWSRWVYLGLFVLLFAVCCLTLTRRLHSRNLGTLPGRTMTFIMVGYQLSMNIFVNLFNAFSVDGAPRIFTTYSVYDEVTTILLFFLLCEILQRSDAEWDNMVLQQMMRQQRQQMELSKETVELINIKCHDIRKQLYTLGSRVPTEELDELKTADLIVSSCNAKMPEQMAAVQALPAVFAYDFGEKEKYRTDAYYDEVCHGIDLAMLSCKPMDKAAFAELCAPLHRRGVVHVLATMGAAGQMLSVQGKIVEKTTQMVEASDTMGAGDSFLAAFLCSLYTAGWQKAKPMPEQALLAALAAGQQVSARNCMAQGGFGCKAEISRGSIE